jgi:hypothetical protein
MTIFKMFDGKHVDISRIIAVGPIESTDGAGEEFDGEASFKVWFQLFDHFLSFSRKCLSEAQTREAKEASNAVIREGRATFDRPTDVMRRSVLAGMEVRRRHMKANDKEFREGYDALMTAWSAGFLNIVDYNDPARRNSGEV